MSSFSAISILVAICCSVSDASRLLRPALVPSVPNDRIVGGFEVAIEEVPWQVLLQAYGIFFCGGSIISDYWVITAGQCSVYPLSEVTVKAGSSMRNHGGTIHPALTLILHEDYKTDRWGIPENDVALIRVSTPFIFDATRQPIALFNYQEDANEGSVSLIAGWGTPYYGGNLPEFLRAVNLPIVSKEACAKAYAEEGGFAQGMICSGLPEGGKGACQGDLGGPLTIDGRLAGISSWCKGCALPGYPVVYAEIATYRNWITEKTNL